MTRWRSALRTVRASQPGRVRRATAKAAARAALPRATWWTGEWSHWARAWKYTTLRPAVCTPCAHPLELQMTTSASTRWRENSNGSAGKAAR